MILLVLPNKNKDFFLIPKNLSLAHSSSYCVAGLSKQISLLNLTYLYLEAK